MSDLALSVLLSTSTTSWLELNDKAVYRVAEGSFASRQVSHRRLSAQSQFLEGEYVYSSVRSNVTEPLNVYVQGATQYAAEAALNSLITALEQTTFTVVRTVGDARYTLSCYASDYTLSADRPLLHAKRILAQIQLLQDPVTVLTQVGATNLAINPSLETDTAGWAAIGGATLARVTNDFHAGVAALRVTHAASGLQGASAPGVTVVPGRTYEFSAWVRNTAGVTSRSMTARITWPNATTTSATVTVTAAAGWTRIAATGVCPGAGSALTTGTATLAVLTGTGASGDLTLVDDIALLEVLA
jgi:hypothetical protein